LFYKSGTTVLNILVACCEAGALRVLGQCPVYVLTSDRQWALADQWALAVTLDLGTVLLR